MSWLPKSATHQAPPAGPGAVCCRAHWWQGTRGARTNLGCSVAGPAPSAATPSAAASLAGAAGLRTVDGISTQDCAAYLHGLMTSHGTPFGVSRGHTLNTLRWTGQLGRRPVPHMLHVLRGISPRHCRRRRARSALVRAVPARKPGTAVKRPARVRLVPSRRFGRSVALMS